jgi:hypothetical protein
MTKKSILCRMDRRLFPMIADIIGYGQYRVNSMLDVSKYHRAAWKDAIRLQKHYIGFASTQILDLHYSPELLIHNSSSDLMWQFINIICKNGKHNYVDKTLIPIINSRPDQDDLWDIEKQNIRWFNSALEVLVYKYIPIQYLNKTIRWLINEDRTYHICPILAAHPEVRMGKTELSIPIHEIYDKIHDMFITTHEYFICGAINLIEAMELYGLPKYKIPIIHIIPLSNYHPNAWRGYINIAIDHLESDPTYVTGGVGYYIYELLEKINRVHPKWVEQFRENLEDELMYENDDWDSLPDLESIM